MAERRMLTKKVTDDDNFINLSSSAQALYLHLSMSADDDGFCNQVSTSMFKAHASVQDLQALLEMRYVYQFDNGVIVIKHWRMANALRKDRYTPTAFQEELAKLEIKENGSYTWLPVGCQMVATDKDRKEEIRIDKESIDKEPYFPSPEVEEVFQEFLKIRKKLKAVNSERAINSLVSKVNEYSAGDESVAVEVITQSIENSWKGIFPLKGKKQSPKQTQTNYFFSQTGVQT